VDLKITFYIC